MKKLLLSIALLGFCVLKSFAGSDTFALEQLQYFYNFPWPPDTNQNIFCGIGGLNIVAIKNAGGYVYGCTSLGCFSFQDGDFNYKDTAIGYSTFNLLTNGQYNSAFGAYAGSNLKEGVSNIYIGAYGVAYESNITRIGQSQTDTYISGVVHANGGAVSNVQSTNLAGIIPQNKLPNSIPSNSVVIILGESRAMGFPINSIGTYGQASGYTGPGYCWPQWLSVFLTNTPVYSYGLSASNSSNATNILAAAPHGATEYSNGAVVGTYSGISGIPSTLVPSGSSGGQAYFIDAYDGGNDEYNGLSLATYINNQTNVFATVRGYGTNVWVMGVTSTSVANSYLQPLNIFPYNNWLRGELKVSGGLDMLADVNATFTSYANTNWYYSDSIHNISAGYYIYAQIVADAIKQNGVNKAYPGSSTLLDGSVPLWGNQGATIAGNVYATTFQAATGYSGNGSGVTNIPSTNIVSQNGNSPFIGSVSNNASSAYYWTNIPAWTNNFTNNGGTPVGSNGYVVLGGQTIWSFTGTNTLLMNGTNSGFVGGVTNYLSFTNWRTAAENWTAHYYIQAVSLTPSVNGIVGIASGIQDALGFGDDFFFQFIAYYSPYTGFFQVFSQTNGSPSTMFQVASSLNGGANQGLLPLTAGQWIDCTLAKRGWNVQAIYSNTVSGAVLKYSWVPDGQSTSTGSFTNGFYPSTGYFTLASGGGTMLVSNLTFSVGTYWPVTLVVAGASIAAGYGSTDPYTSYSGLLKDKMGPGVFVEGGPSDVSSSVVAELPEINLLHPQNFFLLGDVMENDLGYGVSFAATKTNLTNIMQSVSVTGTSYIGYGTPRSSDMTPYVNFVTTNFVPQIQIDTFYPLCAFSPPYTGTYTPNAVFFYTDLVHPNDKGHAVLARTIQHAILEKP